MDFYFRTKPLDHQLAAFEERREFVNDAVFWDMGTGKTKFILDQVVWLFLQGKIDALLVVAPSGVHRNWVTDEIPKHVPEEIQVNAAVWQSQKASTKKHERMIAEAASSKGLAVLTMNYEAFTTKAGKNAAWKFLKNRRVLMVLDESTRVKSPGAKRTRSIIAACKYACYRRLLSGTPITNGPFDAYSQYRCLDENFWKQFGLGQFEAFKQKYGIFQRFDRHDGKSFTTCVGYRFLDHLQEIIDTNSTRVLKQDVLDLPAKTYVKYYVEMEPEQRRLYEQLKDEGLLFFQQGGEQVMIDASLAIVRLLRLQQILCGYLPSETEEPVELIPMKKDGRLNALLEVLQDAGTQKTIVWARFRMDIQRIMQALKDEGINAVSYYGATTQDDRGKAIASFTGKRVIMDGTRVVGTEDVPADQQAQVFVANPSTAGEGLTLTCATNVVYYSNSFKLAERLQSEDRCHRIGQDNKVLYTDIVCGDSVDEDIVSSLRNKLDIAIHLMSDPEKEWI